MRIFHSKTCTNGVNCHILDAGALYSHPSVVFSTEMDAGSIFNEDRIRVCGKWWRIHEVRSIFAPLGAFSQSGHALQWGLILGGNVVLTEGVRRAGWDVCQHVRSLIFGTVNPTEPIWDPAEWNSRAPTASPLTRTRGWPPTEHFLLWAGNFARRLDFERIFKNHRN